jgi:hypothetical protein
LPEGVGQEIRELERMFEIHNHELRRQFETAVAAFSAVHLDWTATRVAETFVIAHPELARAYAAIFASDGGGRRP